MNRSGLWIIPVSCLWAGLSLVGAAADSNAQDAVSQDRRRIAGTWRVTDLTVNGNAVPSANIGELTVVNELDGDWTLRRGEEVIGGGTSELDPSETPKAIDFELTRGEAKGQRFAGIYELETKTRKLCFAAAERGRPSGFGSSTGSQQILVRFERVAKPNRSSGAE
jgi:uncharacterized protein (TIGR03067 family)